MNRVFMRLSFIGMSNIGKSFWAKKLAAGHGYARIDCDALIERRLGAELAGEGRRGLRGVAQWMGFPADPQYKRNSGLYVACEREVMRESFGRMEKDEKPAIVIDTTGSVIYAGADILADLRDTTRVIYFEASDDHADAMLKRYLAHPKPIVWGEDYAPQPGETAKQAIKRCYPALLRNRARRYKELAHATIPFDRHRDHGADIVALIRDYAGQA